MRKRLALQTAPRCGHGTGSESGTLFTPIGAGWLLGALDFDAELPERRLVDGRVALQVVVENGGGSSAASPIARRVIDTWLLGAAEAG